MNLVRTVASGGLVLSVCSAAGGGPPVLYGIDTEGSMLVTVDPATGAVAAVAPVSGGGILGALAWDPAAGTLYAASTSLHELYRLDHRTGSATLVGAFGVGTPFMHGLEWADGVLYGTGFEDPRLFRIDTSTGVATAIGPTGFGPFESFGSLGFDPAAGVLYAANTWEDALYAVNRTTGGTTLVGPFGLGTLLGTAMAFHSDYGMIACDNSGLGPNDLYRIDLRTGRADFIARLSTVNLISLAFVEGPECYADCDTSTGVGTLDIFDFLCFQNRFAAGDPYACECDTSSGLAVCDIFDFLCFQNAFALGCP